MQSELSRSLSQTRKEITSSFSSVQSLMNWWQESIADVDSFRQKMEHVFGTVSVWFQTALWSILIYMLTAIPGVCLCSLDDR